MKVRFLGTHNCESKGSKLVSLLVDDIIAIDAGSLTSGLSFPAQQKLKAILLTHSHYDHIRDVTTLAMNLFLRGRSINVYSLPVVRDMIVAHLLNGKLYPNFLERPQDNPTVKFTAIEPYRMERVEGYDILAVLVNHSSEAVGYQVTSPDGRAIFYTGDTGPGLASCWQHTLPKLLIVEVTAPDRYEAFARESKHLTPSLLKQELITFREINGYLPEVVAVHMNPDLEAEIEVEIAAVASMLGNSIILGNEGMQLHL